jgi:DNA-directed RNA polymerase specialized sigma24 family protein
MEDRHPGQQQFPATLWSVVLRAAGKRSDESSRALERLCESYWLPVFLYIRRRGEPHDSARDLTQEFFSRMIEKQYLASADRTRGRFRSFLLSALKAFLANSFDEKNAVKRGGGRQIIALDVAGGESCYQAELGHGDTPEVIYERRWAKELLARAITRLKEISAHPEFERLKPFLTAESERGDYALVASQMGCTEGALKVTVHRLRKQYGEALRLEILQTVENPDEVDSEIRYLMEALTR